MGRLNFEYRVTKYNPVNRNQNGHYLIPEWTSFGDIGKTYNGVQFESAEYEKVEKTYITAALAFLEESGVNSVVVSGLEQGRDRASDVSLLDGSRLDSNTEISRVIQKVLREEIWCRLESEDKFFVHFGWDYYMYVGSTMPCEKAKKVATDHDLFVEAFASPYKENEHSGT